MRSGSGGTGTGSSDEPEKEGREREQCGVSSKTCPAKQSVSFLVGGMKGITLPPDSDQRVR